MVDGEPVFLAVCVLVGPSIYDTSDAIMETEANADFIVQACNAHDELLAACEDFVYAIEGYEKRTGIIQFHPSVDRARAAIAKARKETP